MSCPFVHDNIEFLYGVPPMRRDQLPKKCTCGAELTYADVVCFVNPVPEKEQK